MLWNAPSHLCHSITTSNNSQILLVAKELPPDVVPPAIKHTSKSPGILARARANQGGAAPSPNQLFARGQDLDGMTGFHSSACAVIDVAFDAAFDVVASRYYCDVADIPAPWTFSKEQKLLDVRAYPRM